MKILVNGKEKIVDIASNCTLSNVLLEVENDFPQGMIATEIVLNNKTLEGNWTQNSDNIYILEDDELSIVIEDSSELAKVALVETKEQFQLMLKHFGEIADSFRINEEKDANAHFIQGIENLQIYLKVLEDATFLMGRPLNKLKDGEVYFQQYISILGKELDKIITIQSQKDWIMLADLIEYELMPALTKIGDIYRLLDI
ncbi:MAG: hypothetical protein FWG98_08675 [Candidatus Cloacimonetes bacterium]|nr:hypothetical protein [Candidatus Cloacimonadota bacterium]